MARRCVWPRASPITASASPIAASVCCPTQKAKVVARLGTGLAVAALLVAPVGLQARADRATDAIAAFDSDHDGTLDRAEVNKAAAAEFDKLDGDHDGSPARTG